VKSCFSVPDSDTWIHQCNICAGVDHSCPHNGGPLPWSLREPSHRSQTQSGSLAFSPSFFEAFVALDMVSFNFLKHTVHNVTTGKFSLSDTPGVQQSL